jgi:hypothetical protein
MRANGYIAGKRCASALSWCCAVAFATAAAAQQPVCKYVDVQGNIVFSNVSPEKGWRKLSCMGAEEPRKASSGGRTTPTPAGFPKVDAETQRSRDDMRRKVLADELSAEEKLLAEARIQYANGAPTPLPEEQSNATKYQERIGRLRQAVLLHERNIEALKKELASTK